MDGQCAEISTGESATTDNWNQAKGRLKGNSENVRISNARLDSFLNNVRKACQELSDKNKSVSALTIRNQMQGIGQNFHGIVECFERFAKEIKLKIGSDYKIGTLKNYNVILETGQKFVVSFLPPQVVNYQLMLISSIQ